MKSCSISPRARMTRRQFWGSGTALRWRKSNLPCIFRTSTRNLRKMNPGCAAEQAAWRELKDGWRPLYGDVDKIGVAIEWHDFRIERSFNWGRTFHPNSLEFCLNLNGHGAVGGVGGTRSDYLPGNCGYYAVADEPLPASRRAHDHHQFVTLEFSREHLRNQLAQNEADLEPQIRRILFGKKEENLVAPARPMTMQQRSVVASLTEPPVPKAATEVGYSSLSHFSKAFCETIGCCPVLYPVAKNVLLDR